MTQRGARSIVARDDSEQAVYDDLVMCSTTLGSGLVLCLECVSVRRTIPKRRSELHQEVEEVV